MADSSEPTEEELIFSIKEALKHSKSEFERRISNGHKLRDLDITFNRLNKVELNNEIEPYGYEQYVNRENFGFNALYSRSPVLHIPSIDLCCSN